MKILIIIILGILVAFLGWLSYDFHKMWRMAYKKCNKLAGILERTKEYYATILSDKDEALSSNLPEVDKCPLDGRRCWRATAYET